MANLLDKWEKNAQQSLGGTSMLDQWESNAIQGGAISAPQPPPDEGILSNIWKGGKAGVAGSVGGLAGWFGGKNAVTDYTDEVLQENQRSREHDGYDADYFLNGSGFAYDVGNLLGSFASMAPAALLVPGGAPATIASAGARLLGGLGARELARRAAVQAAQKGGGALGNYIRYGLGAGTAESLVEGGSGVSRAVQEGQEGLSPYLTGAEIAAKNWPLLVGSQALEGGILHRGFSRLGGKAGESLAKRAGLAPFRTAPYMAGEGLTESAQEVMQERAQEEAFNEPTGGILPSDMTENERKAFYATLAPAALLGGIGGFRGSMRAKGNEPESKPAPYVANWDNGMNGLDTDLFDKWESAPGMTDLTGVRRDVVAALNGLANEYGGKITITGAAEKGVHAEGEDGHEGGWKVDIDKNLADPEKFLELAAKYGFAVGDEGDHYDLSANRKGGVGGKKVATPDAFVSDGQTSSVDTSSFNDKQREAWKEAQWVQSQTGIPAEFIYRQWAHESGNFTSRLAQENNNFGGLTQSEPNGEENKQPDGGNYYRQFGNMHEYAQSYVNDFINRYDGKEKVKTLEDFANFLHDNGYYTDSPENYIAGMRGVDAPSGDADMGGPTTSSTRQEEAKIDTYDDVYEQFAKEMSQSSDEETKDFFSGMFTKNDKFVDSEENRRKIDERYGEELKEFADVYRNPSVQTQIDRLIDKAVKAKDYNRVGKLQAARMSGDIQLMQKYLNEAKAKEAPQMQGQTVPQVIPQQAPAQNVPQAKPAFPIVQTGGNVNGNTQSTQSTQTQPPQGGNAVNQNQNAESGQNEAEEVSRRLQVALNNANLNNWNLSDEDKFEMQELQRRLMALTGQKPAEIYTGEQKPSNLILPEKKPEPEPKKPGFMQTAEERVSANADRILRQRIQDALRKKDFALASQLAQQSGSKELINLVDSIPARPEPHQISEAVKALNTLPAPPAPQEQQESPTTQPSTQNEPASKTTSTPVQEAPQEKPKKDSKALSQFKKNCKKIVADYRKDKITYEEAFQKVVAGQTNAERVAPDSDKDAIQDVARNALLELEAIYKEKNGHEIGETPSQAAQESAGEQETTAQVEEPTQEEKPAQSEAEPASNGGGGQSAQKQEKPFGKMTPSEQLIRLVEIDERAYKNGEYGLVTLEQNLRKDEADAKKLDKDEAQKVLDAIKTVRDRHIGSSQKALDREVEKANKEEAKYDNDRRGKWKVISEAGNLKVVQPWRYNTKTKRYESYLPYNGEETYTTEDEAWNLAKKLNQQEEKSAQNATVEENSTVGENGNPKQTEQEKSAEQTEGKTDTKLKRIRHAKEEMQAVAKKYADGEISQAEAYKQIATIAKGKATKAKDGLPNVTFIDNKIKQELNDYGDRLIDATKQEGKPSSKSDFLHDHIIVGRVTKDGIVTSSPERVFRNLSDEEAPSSKQEEATSRLEQVVKKAMEVVESGGRSLDNKGTREQYNAVVELLKLAGIAVDNVKFVGRAGNASIGGSIMLDDSKTLSIHAPVHEYTHIWDYFVMINNPRLWAKGVALMKESPLWQVVKKEYPNHNDDRIATECHAYLTGAYGEDILNEMAKSEKTLADKLKGWLKEFWRSVKNALAPWTDDEISSMSLEDFLNMPLSDLAEGTKIGEALRYYESKRRETALKYRDEMAPELEKLGIKVNDDGGFVATEETPSGRAKAKENINKAYVLMARKTVEASEEKTSETAEPKQEKPAEAENNTVKADGEGLRKEAQRFKDLVDKAVKAYDEATSTDSLTRKKVAIEKISGYYDDLSPELKDHQQIRGIYENARIHFNYNEGEHMLSAKEAVLTDKFSKDVDKYVESGLSNEDAIMGAVNDILGKKSFMGNAMKAIKKNLENVLGDKVKSKALAKDPASYVKYLFTTQPVHTFFDGDEAIGKYSPAAVASILINRIKSGVTDIDELFSTKEGNNEQQAESGSPDGGHEGVRTRESGSDQREKAGGVSEHDGRKGKGHGSDNVEEHSEEPQSAGVRAGAELDSAASTRTDKRGNQPDVPLTEAQAHPSPTETPGHNYEIKESGDEPNKRDADVRYKQNIEAIKLLRQLEDEERMATPAEQKILAQFNGWGGLTSKFKEGSETDKELRSLLSAEEYKDAQRSSLSAYYTPPKIVKAIWAGLAHLGFKGGRILDPAMGVGNFFGCMPRDIMAKSVLDGVEMESLAARLARQLYPGADVQNATFQRSNTPKNFYDLVITNVPFEQTIVNGYQVHNYYFAAGIDKVRPGGLMVYITGQGSLASGSDAARMRTYLNKEADLIGAFKLPSGVFDATQVGTDVVVFQKRIDGKKSPHGQDFTEVEQKGTYGNFYGVNQYFTQHRENVLGEMSVGRNRFGDTELNVKSRGTVEDVAGELEAAMKKLPKNVYEPVSRNKAKQFNPSETAKRAKADEKTRDREYYYKDGKIVQNQNGQETEIKGKQAEVVESYVKLKNSLNALLAAETDPKATDKQVEGLRDMLNRDYNDFVKKHGYLHGANKRHFDDDPSSGMVQSLETPIETEEKTKSGATKKKVTGAKKASIFSERSTNPKKEVTHVDTTSDALVASLNNKGGLDLEYMAKLTGKTQEKLLSELKGTVFKDPATENFVTKDEYLSGNVREKLILAKEMAKRDKSYAANVKALEEVQPEELVPEEIFVSLGTPWIPAQDVNDFVHTIANGKFTVHYNSALAKWTVTGWLNSTKFGTQHIDFDDFLTKVLNGQVIEIKYTDEDKKTHVDEAATKAVTAEAERLQAEFKEWIWKDKERAKRLTDYYNANFNNYVLREYDGSHLDPHEHGMNAKITLKPHQKDAVWRILQSGNTLLAHCVGAGKTFEMQTAGMEMRRLGMANKPMYLVPLNVVDQFAKDFRRLYPGAKLLVLTNDDLPKVKLTKKVTKTADGRIEITDLTKDMSAKEKERIAKNKAKRARTLARIRTEDWDGIIMSHTLFKELPVSPETQAAYMEEEFKRLEAALKEAKQTDSLDGKAKRTLEEQKAKLQEKMEEARSVDVKDLGITFEQLGIDQLFVDEADLFKNLHFTSSKTSGNTKIKGITNPEANYKHRAFDMFLKTQWLSKTLNGRGVVFATGTPISNSMAELYTMMRYLDPQGLKEHGTELFDSWIGVFGDIGQDTQLNSTGTNWETVTKVRSYNNRPELLKMFRKFADIKQPSDLPDIKRPALKGGKPTIIDLPVDPAVSRYLKERVPKRIEAMSGGFKKQKGEDNMLALMNDLRNLSLSDSKIEACADTIVSEYKDSTPVKGTQLVFCDLGIPKAESEKEDADDEGSSKKVSEIANPDVYRKLIEKLVKKGIPREQIAFIQDYPKDKRQAVFEKVNNGEIRILIGSTTAMGAGTNCQKHLVALHDLDAPWRPRDLEQRHGRILRQGNENSEVSIYQYALKGSFDAVIWSKLKEKALLIELAMSSDMNSRSMEEADIITLEYSEMVGHSLDDPLMKAKVDTENELSKVRNAQTEFSKKVQKADNTLATIDDKIETHQKAVEHIKKDIAGRKSTRGDNFSMTVGNKTFTKRDDAGNAMEARLKDFDESKPTVVGSLGGFALKAVKTITGIEMEVVGKHAYPVKTISVQGLENTVNVQVDDALEREEAYLEYLNQQKKDALDIQGQENPYAEKVKSLEEKLADLNRQIKERAVEESKKQNDTETEEAQEEKPSSNKEYSVTEGKVESRSIEDIKAGAREAYPNAKIQEDGNTLHLTMPNGQKIHISIVNEINASEDELSRAKEAHGIGQGAQVSVEGYAEVVGGEGFSAVAQGSRDVTDFHEAYHMAELMAFTKKELRDAERLISPSSEERADEYARWKKSRQKHSNFAKLWQKIADVAAKMAGILGYETKRNIFRKLESGEIYQRDNTARNTSRQYSLMSDDNSKAGLKRKISNILSGKKESPRYRQRVKELMEKIAGVRIYYGKMAVGKGMYEPIQKYIRVANANDWDEMTYQFSAAVCDNLGIKWNPGLGTYVSSWLLTGEATNDSEEAKAFREAMAENPNVREQLLDLQDAFLEWNRMSGADQVRNSLSFENEEHTSWSDRLNQAYDQFIEELGPIKRLVESIEKKSGVKQSTLTNPYSAFRLFRGAAGRAMTMIEGNEKSIDGLRKLFPAIDWNGFKTIHMILDSIGGLKDKKVRQDFDSYVIAKHVLDIHSFNHGLEGQIAKIDNEIKALGDSDKKKTKELLERRESLRKRFMRTPFTEAACRETIKEFDDRFSEAQQDLVHYSNTMLAILHDSGVISDTKYEKLLKKWPNYVPMFRVFDDNDKAQWGDSLKEMQGSSRDPIEPLQSIIRNTFDMVKRAEKNKCKNLLANLAEMDGAGEVLTEVDQSAPQDGTTIVFYRNGEKRYLQTDPAVVSAVNNMGVENASMFIRLLRFPAAIARAAFTVMNPSFIVRNTARDVQDAFVYNKHGYITPMDIVRGFMHAIRQDEVYWEWMASGAAQASAASIDRDYTQSTLDKMTKTNLEKWKNPVNFLTDVLLKFAEVSELGTRIGTYERIKKNLAKDGRNVSRMELAEAALESRDLMDFARGGRSSRTWNRVAIFANASIQGWDKFFRTFDFRKRPKEASLALARLAFASLLPALVLALMNRDKDWWKELPDWQKNTHWILSENIRIPKGQDIGLRATSAIIDKMFDDRPNKLKRGVFDPLWEQTPDIIPTAMLPVIEAIANYSFFRKAPIVPQYQKDLPAKLQYNGTTSSMAKWLGEKLDVSPRKIEHVVYGYGGNLARAGANLYDTATGSKRMNTAVEEMPIMQGFMMTPFKNAQTVTDFYEELQRQKEGDKAFKATRERMEGYSPAKYKRMNAASKKMSELNKKERKLLDDNRISPERKQELQAGIQRQRIAIAKRAMGK